MSEGKRLYSIEGGLAKAERLTDSVPELQEVGINDVELIVQVNDEIITALGEDPDQIRQTHEYHEWVRSLQDNDWPVASYYNHLRNHLGKSKYFSVCLAIADILRSMTSVENSSDPDLLKPRRDD